MENKKGFTPRSLKSKTGEIATLITIGTLVVIGISTLVSSVFLKNKQTTKTKALEIPSTACTQCTGAGNTCEYKPFPGCTDNGCTKNGSNGIQCEGDKNNSSGTTTNQCKYYTSVSEAKSECGETNYEKVSDIDKCWRCKTSTSSTSSSDTCQCVNGKANNVSLCGDTNPCGPVPDPKAAPNGNAACSGKYGDWGNLCAGTNENCPSDAGVTYTYWCDGANWRFQYANCVTWCKTEYMQSKAAADPLCEGVKAGSLITDKFPADKKPEGTELGSTYKLDYKYVSCDGNQGVWVEVNPFCDATGRVSWAPGRKTAMVCTPPDIDISKAPNPSGINVNANVTVKKTDKGAEFDTEAAVTSNDCDGDLSLFVNGNRTAISGWNRKAQGSTFTFPKDYGTVSVNTGDSQNFTYAARLDNCPRSKVPLTDQITCNFGVSPYGIPWVRGAGCNLQNYSEVSQMKALSTPVPKPTTTWAKPPVPKNAGSSVIFSGENTAGKTPCENNGGNCASYIGGDKNESCRDNFGDAYKYISSTCNSGYVCCKSTGSSSSSASTTGPGTPVGATSYSGPTSCETTSANYYVQSMAGRITGYCLDNKGNGCVATRDEYCKVVSLAPVSGYCPDDNMTTDCSPNQPAVNWEKTWMSCYSVQDICWVKSDKASLYPTPVPQEKTIEIDSYSDLNFNWWSHAQVCDYVGEKSFLGINGLIVKNCRDPVYELGTTPGKTILKYTKKTGIKTVLCSFGGNGNCVNLP